MSHCPATINSLVKIRQQYERLIAEKTWKVLKILTKPPETNLWLLWMCMLKVFDFEEAFIWLTKDFSTPKKVKLQGTFVVKCKVAEEKP